MAKIWTPFWATSQPCPTCTETKALSELKSRTQNQRHHQHQTHSKYSLLCRLQHQLQNLPSRHQHLNRSTKRHQHLSKFTKRHQHHNRSWRRKCTKLQPQLRSQSMNRRTRASARNQRNKATIALHLSKATVRPLRKHSPHNPRRSSRWWSRRHHPNR